MAQIPKGRLVKGPHKPICRDCAMYFSTAVLQIHVYMFIMFMFIFYIHIFFLKNLHLYNNCRLLANCIYMSKIHGMILGKCFVCSRSP